MKAYRYTRDSAGWHWSTGISETIFYIPDYPFIIYQNSGVFGFNKDSKFIEEAKAYISDIKSGNIDRDEAPNTFKKNYPSITVGNTTHAAYSLFDLDEIELSITEEELQNLLSEFEAFK